MSDLGRNPEGLFSHIEAHITETITLYNIIISVKISVALPDFLENSWSFPSANDPEPREELSGLPSAKLERDLLR